MVVSFAAAVLLAAVAGPAWAASATDPITTVAGNGAAFFGGDGLSAPQASLRTPVAVAVDGSGNLYIADARNNRVRKVDASGIISTVAGTGTAGFSGDGGPATRAQLSYPSDVAVDASGNLYIASYEDRRVRRVDAAGVIRTVAGTGTGGYSGDGGPATEAELFACGVALASGNLYIADCGNHRVRKVNSAG
ncbi:MAG: serine/threonine protein kinase, partial [Actinobacteria bacterium]|nr:serine/threonine protein kinase [Actinomycetota bacterium]